MSADQRNDRRSGGWKPKFSMGTWFALAITVLLAVYIGLLEYAQPHVSGEPLSIDRFVDLAERDRIRDARILDSDGFVVGTYVTGEGETRGYNAPYFKSEASRVTLLEILVPNNIPTTVDQQNTKRFVGTFSLLLPGLITILVFGYLILSYRAGSGLFNVRSGARKLTRQEGSVTFDDVAGQDAAVKELREVSQFLADPERFRALGAQVPKGVLLFGPPGCGKTLLARALAGEAGASFYSISGSDFVEMYVGVGAARVRDLFREARENAPAIVFVDEIDAVGRRRGGAGRGRVEAGSHDEQDQALTGMLAEMDGFSPMAGIIVVGATNRPDVLDPALLRPGRFDRSIGLETPDEHGRLAILQVHADGKPLAPGVDLKVIAHRALGMTGADLANVVNEAGLLAARAGQHQITQAVLEEALTRILEAPERQRRLSMRGRTLGQRSLTDEQVTFADVAGVDDAKLELAEVRDYLSEPERFTSLGAHIPRGFLLEGPPGTGKTLLARAVAGEANAAFFAMAGTEFTEIFVGEGASRVRDLFAQARGVAPAIVFIDEIDAIGAKRGAGIGDGASRENDQTLNQLLIELDGFGQRSGVVVIAATNRTDMLDPALLRPGRFDRQITVDLPDQRGRRAILDVHAKDKRLGVDVDLDRVASLTRGLAGADLANVLNEAALLAGRRGSTEIDMGLVEEGIDRALSGVGSGRIMSDEERRVVAYHEAGHGLVARMLEADTIVHKLSILPRGRRLGVAWLPESTDRLLYSRSALVGRMATLLAGRAAEEMVFGESSGGASDDLARVGETARMMVCDLGMSERVRALSSGRQRSGWWLLSDETTRLIDSEVSRLVEEAEELARAALTASRSSLDRVAMALLERETLTLDEIDTLAGPPPPLPARDGNGARGRTPAATERVAPASYT